MWGRGQEGVMAPAPLCHPQSNWAPLVLVPEWVGLCTPQAPVCLSNDLSREAGSLSRCHSNPHQPPRAFSVRGLRLYFLELEPWVARSALLPAICPVYLCVNVGPPGATCRSACPILRHSESSPLGLSVCQCGAAGSASGRTACPTRPTLHQSQSRHSHASPLHPGACLCPSYWSG